jgi:hypothetical protein
VSLYQLNRAVYDWVRAGEVNSDAGGDGRAGFVAAFYRMGLHEVLINRFARAAGYGRDDYRKILEPYAEPNERRGRWQK